jgi:hypothetical protein
MENSRGRGFVAVPEEMWINCSTNKKRMEIDRFY